MKVVDSGGGGLSNQTSSSLPFVPKSIKPPTKIQHIVQVKQEKKTSSQKIFQKICNTMEINTQLGFVLVA